MKCGGRRFVTNDALDIEPLCQLQGDLRDPFRIALGNRQATPSHKDDGGGDQVLGVVGDEEPGELGVVFEQVELKQVGADGACKVALELESVPAIELEDQHGRTGGKNTQRRPQDQHTF